MLEKPIEFYIAVAAAAIFVFESNKDRPVVSRFLMTVSSAMLGFSLGPSLASFIGGWNIVSAVVVTALGFIVLEIAAALFKDGDFVKEIIRRKFGGE